MTGFLVNLDFVPSTVRYDLQARRGGSGEKCHEINVRMRMVNDLQTRAARIVSYPENGWWGAVQERRQTLRAHRGDATGDHDGLPAKDGQ
jgi:hypothetical protein